MWRDGAPHGNGTMRWPNGDTYRGQWKKGMRHGNGTYTLRNGKSVTGEWRDDAFVER